MKMSEFREYVLSRSGDAPLRFIGQLVASSNSQQPTTKRDLPLERRWHVLTLYQTRSGQYVGHIAYRTTWAGETEDSLACVGVLPEVADWFRDHDPMESVEGYPPGAGFAARQERLLSAIEAGYDAALSKLLAEAGFTETID